MNKYLIIFCIIKIDYKNKMKKIINYNNNF